MRVDGDGVGEAADTYAALRQLLHQAPQVIQITGQTIHAVDYDSGRPEHNFQLGPLGVLARSLVGEQFVHLGLFQLVFRILIVAANPDVTDALSLQS